jgi:hypothetical protein
MLGEILLGLEKWRPVRDRHDIRETDLDRLPACGSGQQQACCDEQWQ